MSDSLKHLAGIFQALVLYANLRWYCFPCRPNKTPYTSNGHKAATTDSEQHRRWWDAYPEALIAIRTGPESNIFVLDIDVDPDKHVDGLKWLNAQLLNHGPFPSGPLAQTPRGGLHYYFRYPEGREVRCSVGKIAVGVDVRGSGGYVIGPPSRSSVGEWTWKLSPSECLPPNAPVWLLELISEPRSLTEHPLPAEHDQPLTDADRAMCEREIDLQIQRVSNAVRGTRNHILNVAAFDCGKIIAAEGASEAEVTKRLTDAAEGVGLEAHEVTRTIRSGLGAGKRQPWRPSAANAQLVTLNRDYFFALEGKAGFVFREEIDSITGNRSLARIYPSAFRELFANRWVSIVSDGVPKQVQLGTMWMRWPGRRQYYKVVFAPGRTPPASIYNQWQGFTAEPIKGDWSGFRKYLLEVLCTGDEVVFDYLTKWCSRAVQQPASQGEVAVVLRGRKGVGKSFFASHFGELFGDHYAELSHSRHLVGNFNAHLETAVLVFADEAFWAGDKQGEGALKALITSRRLLLERKGIDARTVPNYTHLIIASNSDWVVPASPDERRFFVLDVSDQRREDHEYFGGLELEWQNGGREAFMHDLLQLDISAFNVRQVPQTHALLEQKLHSLSNIDRWYFGLLQAGCNWDMAMRDKPSEPGSEHKPIWVEWVPTEDLFGKLTEFSKGGRDRAPNREALGMRLNVLLPPPTSGKSRRTQRSTGRGRQWGYEFPPLDECRQHFEKVMGYAFEWDESGEIPYAPKARF